MEQRIVLAPHNDDETLFCAYTILRHKPKVIICTDSYIELERGDGVTKEQRIEETKNAMKILGAEVEFLHIPDNKITEDILREKLQGYKCDTMYAPAVEEGGNPTHNLIGRVAGEMFNTTHYMTYTKDDTKTKGSTFLFPIDEEKELKRMALACYPSQMGIATTRPFFEHKDVLAWESYL